MKTLRRITACVTTLLSVLIVTGCAAESAVLPQGWNWVVVNQTYLPVPDAWTMTSYDSDVPVWSVSWRSSDPAEHLAAGQLAISDDQDELFQQAIDALRDTSVGFVYGQTRQINTAQSEVEIWALDYTTDTAGQQQGRLWILSNGQAATAVTLFSETLDEDNLALIEKSLKMDPAGEDGTVQSGWTRAGEDGVTLAIPSSYYELKTPEGTERWTNSWAQIDLAGRATQRILLATNLPQGSVEDAFLQIESDSLAGAITDYERVDQTYINTQREDLTILRADFTSKTGGGSIWIISNGEAIAAVQLIVEGNMDQELRGTVESSLWMGEAEQ